MPGRVIISCRIDESHADARALKMSLEHAFGSKHVVMCDVQFRSGKRFDLGTQNGPDWRDVFIPVISPQWLLHYCNHLRRGGVDHARKEIATALLSEATIIPVLIDNATMPSADALPDELRALAEIPPLTITRTRFKNNSKKLIWEISAAQKHNDEKTHYWRLSRAAAVTFLAGASALAGVYFTIDATPSLSAGQTSTFSDTQLPTTPLENDNEPGQTQYRPAEHQPLSQDIEPPGLEESDEATLLEEAEQLGREQEALRNAARRFEEERIRFELLKAEEARKREEAITRRKVQKELRALREATRKAREKANPQRKQDAEPN